MLAPNKTPSLVPEFDVTVHVVLDDFGKAGRTYREVDDARADFDTIVGDLFTGQFNNPVRVVAFNTAEGWARDVSEDMAWALLKRVTKEGKPIPDPTRSFVEFHVGEEVTLQAEHGLV